MAARRRQHRDVQGHGTRKPRNVAAETCEKPLNIIGLRAIRRRNGLCLLARADPSFLGHPMQSPSVVLQALSLLALSSVALAQEPVPPPAPADVPAQAPPPTAPSASTGASFGLTPGTPAPPSADTGAKPPQDQAAKQPPKVPFRGSLLFWDNSVSTETIGVGRDPQTRNPLYEMSLVFRPRWYFYDTDVETAGVRGDVAVVREMTNSDTTTDRGETTLTDAQLFGAYSRQLYVDDDYETTFGVRAPVLTFPTSTVSFNNGRYLAVGTQLSLEQFVPLRGSEADSFHTLRALVSAAYTHWFTRATVPTSPGLDRVRLEPGGRSLPSDQLSGAAFAEHQATFSVLLELAITDRVSWSNEFRWQPSWGYGLGETCVQTVTGCEPIPAADGHFGVVTLFASEVSVQVFDEMSVQLGYNNLTLQIDPNGQRRNMLYSPDARVYATITAHLDAIYLSLTGQDKPEAAKSAQGAQVARR
jgi:hypothetical protein